MNLAERFALLGRSMQKNVEIAEEHGLLKIAHGTMIELGGSRALDDDEICYLVTGSQGEMRAALWNLATGDLQRHGDRKGRHGRAFGPHHSRQ